MSCRARTSAESRCQRDSDHNTLTHCKQRCPLVYDTNHYQTTSTESFCGQPGGYRVTTIQLRQPLTSQQAQLPLSWRTGSAVPEPSPNPPKDLEMIVSRLAAAIAEVYCGVRPVQQLRPFLSPRALRRLESQIPRHPAPNAPIKSVLSVRLSANTATSIEACAVVRGRQRSHAVALHLRYRRDGWIATAVEIH